MKIDVLRNYVKKQIKEILDEVSATGGVAGYETPFAFSKRGVKNKATKYIEKLGYDVLQDTDEQKNLVSESTDVNDKADYDQLVQSVEKSETDLTNKSVEKLRAAFSGKKVVAKSSKGYKQFEKDYHIQVANVKIDDYYGTKQIIFVGDDGKEYFLNLNFKVKVVSGGSTNPVGEKPAESKPVAPAKPEQPVKPQTPLDKEIEK